MVSDDALLPAAPALLGAEAHEALAAAVEFAGGRLRGVKPTQVQYYPGRSLAVLYDARIAWPGRPPATEALVAMTAVDGPPEGSLPLEADGLRIGVWRLAHDPLLPGLKIALSKSGARELLGQRGGPVGMSLVSYRPTRRAVVRLTGTATRYVKVVRPAAAADLRAVHDRMVGALPAPRVVGGADDLGLVCLEALPGRPMVEVIASGGPLPSGRDLLDLLDRLGPLPPAGRARPSPRADAHAQARLLTAVLPDEAERVARLLGGLGDDPVTPAVTVHGDFYEAQLLVDAGGVTGVLDLDRSGPGSPADDLATMLGHLTALAVYRPPLARYALAYAAELWRDFSAVVDADDLRQRAAAVVIGLATGPFRLQQPDWQRATGRYLGVAEAWLAGTAVDLVHSPTPMEEAR